MLAGRYGLRGATTVIENLASNLINCGIDVTIGALQFLRAPLIKGIETQKISLNPIQASRQLKKYDIINNHHGLVNLISLLSKKPFIFQGHGAPNYGYSRIYKPNLLNPAYLVQNRITNFIAISDAKNRELKEKFSEDKVFLLKNGVDINRYRPNLEKRFRKGDPQLLFVGNLHPHKNVEEIIRSIPTLIPEYPNVNFQIIGDGKEFDMLENLIKEIDVQKNVELLGRISLEDLPFYYNSCDGNDLW